jgi:hypothetical protein
MASPVDTSVKNFNSAMSGALALSGTQNALAVMLDAYLKDGSDTKTLTSLTVAGGVASAAFTGTHAAIAGSVVLIAGVTGGPAGFAGHNGEQRVTAVGAGLVRYATTLPDGAYTGAITMKMAPLGWLKPFNFANGGVYKSADPLSTGLLLRVDDSGTLNARVRAYESMSDANTGLGLTPLESQVPGGLYWPKSGVAGATARPWYLVGDGRGFYLAVAPLGGERYTLIYVGDFASVKATRQRPLPRPGHAVAGAAAAPVAAPTSRGCTPASAKPSKPSASARITTARPPTPMPVPLATQSAPIPTVRTTA